MTVNRPGFEPLSKALEAPSLLCFLTLRKLSKSNLNIFIIIIIIIA